MLRADAREQRLRAGRTGPRGAVRRESSASTRRSSRRRRRVSGRCASSTPRCSASTIPSPSASSSCRSSWCTRLGVDDVGATFPHTVAYHPTCHSLRVTRVGDAPLRLLRHVRALELVRARAARRSAAASAARSRVKNADTSSAILADKCDATSRRAAPSSAPRSTARASCRSAAGCRGAARDVRADAPRGDPGVDDERADRAVPASRHVASSRTRSCARTCANATDTIRAKRARVVAELDDWEELREAGRAIKADVLARLDEYLLQFEAAVDGGRRAGALGARRRRGERGRRRGRAAARRDRGREGEVADDRRDRAQRRTSPGRASTRSRPTSRS